MVSFLLYFTSFFLILKFCYRFFLTISDLWFVYFISVCQVFDYVWFSLGFFG